MAVQAYRTRPPSPRGKEGERFTIEHTFRANRFYQGYNDLGQHTAIRFPLKRIDKTSDKVFLLLQVFVVSGSWAFIGLTR